MLNDFHSVGYSALTMNVDSNHQIQKPSIDSKDKMVIAGFGTGLGIVMIKDYLNRNNSFQVFPAEGGHLPASINNFEEFEFEMFVKQNMKLHPSEYVSMEYYIAGIGIVWMYKFLCMKNKIECEDNLDGKKVFSIL